MTSGTAAGGVFVCRKMLRNAKTCQQVRKSWEVSLLDRKFFLTSAWTSPGVPVVGRWKIEPVGIPFFDSRAIFDFLAGRFGTSPALSQRLPLLSILEGTALLQVSLDGLQLRRQVLRPAADPRAAVPSPAALSGRMARFVEPCVNAHYGVPLPPSAAILLTAGTWSCRPLRPAGRRDGPGRTS